MLDNKRNSNRIGLEIEIKITCQDQSEHILKSRNISDNGVFLEHDHTELSLAIGTCVVLQVCSQLGDEPPPPPVDAEVTRITNDGIGLKFIL